MQESEQRKKYHKTVSPLFSDAKNIPRASKHCNHQHRKTHFSKKRMHKEEKTKVKKSRKWHTFNHATLKHTHCASTYVGSERLTKQVGFLTKGKISDSISRLEKIIPSNLKARANQDLHRILKSANRSQHYMASSFPEEDSMMNSSPNCSNPCNEVINSPMKCYTSPPRQQENFISKINKMAQTTSSLLQENCSLSSDDFHVSAQTVTDTLYPVIARTNKQIFKEISNLGILKKELLSIKMRYHLDKKTPSSSSNNDSSQDVLRYSDDNFELNPILTQEECPPEIFKEKFELNPVLTQSPRTPKNLTHLFPDAQNNCLSSIEEIENDDYDKSSHSMESNFDYDLIEQKSCSSSDFEDKRVPLVPQTPSSNGSPVWVPVVSPIKFAPKYAPTPKLYYRQKMF